MADAPRQDLIDRGDRAENWADHFDKRAGHQSTRRSRLMTELAQAERQCAILYRRLVQITPK